mmetsp:Transcript_12448/g.27859  ORF Transcript_12448/g.27859 Transcript_12448/m.27859 type:complete len:203 (-) Transcript_12448:238-846(-)
MTFRSPRTAPSTTSTSSTTCASMSSTCRNIAPSRRSGGRIAPSSTGRLASAAWEPVSWSSRRPLLSASTTTAPYPIGWSWPRSSGKSAASAGPRPKTLSATPRRWRTSSRRWARMHRPHPARPAPHSRPRRRSRTSGRNLIRRSAQLPRLRLVPPVPLRQQRPSSHPHGRSRCKRSRSRRSGQPRTLAPRTVCRRKSAIRRP